LDSPTDFVHTRIPTVRRFPATIRCCHSPILPFHSLLFTVDYSRYRYDCSLSSYHVTLLTTFCDYDLDTSYGKLRFYHLIHFHICSLSVTFPTILPHYTFGAVPRYRPIPTVTFHHYLTGHSVFYRSPHRCAIPIPTCDCDTTCCGEPMTLLPPLLMRHHRHNSTWISGLPCVPFPDSVLLPPTIRSRYYLRCVVLPFYAILHLRVHYVHT